MTLRLKYLILGLCAVTIHIKTVDGPKNYKLSSFQGSKYQHYNARFEQLARQTYEDFYNRTQNSPIHAQIPKIIHFIWLGGKLPSIYNFCIQSWQRHHPNWEIMIWDDELAQKFDFRNKEIFNSVTNYGAKADILRLAILNEFGGVYVDIDFFCLKPIDYYADHTSLLIGKAVGSMIGNGIMGASKNHEFIRQAVDQIALNHKAMPVTTSKIDLDPGQIINSFGPYFIAKELLVYLKQDHQNLQNTLILPQSYLHPFPNERREEFWNYRLSLLDIIQQYVYPETIAIHLWSVSWLTKKADPFANHHSNPNYDPLISAVRHKDYKQTELLLRNGYNPNITDKAGKPPILYAAINNQVDLGKLLVLFGANPAAIHEPIYHNFVAQITNNYPKNKIIIITKATSNKKNLQRKLLSIFNQTYDNWDLYYITNTSPNLAQEPAYKFSKALGMLHKIHFIKNRSEINKLLNQKAIIVNIEKDDYLYSNHLLSLINESALN